MTRLEKGEAIILFGGRRIYARLFTADIKPQGAMRVRQGMAGIGPGVVENIDELVEAVAARLSAGMDLVHGDDHRDGPSPVVEAALRAYAAAIADKLSPRDETRRILDAVAAIQTATLSNADHDDTIRPAAEPSEPWHPFGPMLASVVKPKRIPAPVPKPGVTWDPELINFIMAIETRTGSSPADARYAAMVVYDPLAQGTRVGHEP